MSSSFLKNKSLCPLPFAGAIVNTDGSVQCCSISKEYLGNVNKQSLNDILTTSPKLKQIRRDMPKSNTIKQPILITLAIGCITLKY